MAVTLTSGDSPFFDTLGLYDKGGKLAYTLGTNKDQYGKQVKLNANQLSSAGYRSGDELIFGIDVKNRASWSQSRQNVSCECGRSLRWDF